MSAMRHLLEFRHREFATFLRSRGTLPSIASARPRPRHDYPTTQTTTRSSALPLPPLPALPTLSQPAQHVYQPQHPSLHAPSRTPITRKHHAKHVALTLVTDTDHVADISKKRPRDLPEVITPAVKRKKEQTLTYSNLTSPTGVAANVVTPGPPAQEYDTPKFAKDAVPQIAPTRSSSEQTEDVDDSVVTPGFDCEICGTRFYRKHHLERHIQNIHEGQRPWTCDQCGFAFHQKPNLERHIMTVHQDQKPYRCEVCDMSFGRKGVLKKHVQMVHEHSRKFECEICSIPFGLKSDLKRHVQSVHQKKRPFVCDVCSATFARRSDLKRHTLSQHPGVELPTLKNSAQARQNGSP